MTGCRMCSSFFVFCKKLLVMKSFLHPNRRFQSQGEHIAQVGLSLFRGQKFAGALVIRYGDKAGTFFAQGLGIGKQGEGFHLQGLDFAHKGSGFPGDVFAVEYAAGGNRAGNQVKIGGLGGFRDNSV